MTQQVVIDSPAGGLNRRQPLLTPVDTPRNRIGEVAGGTAAECAAVCCCCPCGVMHLFILAVYRLPTGLLKKAWKTKKRNGLLKKKKKAMLDQQQKRNSGSVEKKHGGDEMDGEDDDDDDGVDEGVMDAVLDKEMWDRFHGAGFWRSPSERKD